jgi:hypothetical protein
MRECRVIVLFYAATNQEKNPVIHELRIYRCMPGRLPDLNKRFETVTLKLWEKHGFRPVGFWTTVIGESNQDLTYLLEWKDLGERERVWAGFMSDADWLKARAESEKNGPVVAQITSSILAPTAFSKLR